jgi:hypothetical protein
VLEGTLNPTRHRHRKHEPKPRGELVDPPSWMDDAHKDVWREQLRACSAGLLKRLDQKMMATWFGWQKGAKIPVSIFHVAGREAMRLGVGAQISRSRAWAGRRWGV